MADKKIQAGVIEGVGGRLSKGKSASYVDAVMRIEGRSNQFTARYMLLGDLAFALSAMELGVTPREEGLAICRALLDLLPQAEELGRERTAGDIVLQRELWVAEIVGHEVGAWQQIGRHRAESLRGYLPRMFFRDALCRQRDALIRLITVLVEKAAPALSAPAPVYHHLQHAGITTLGEYLLSFASNLFDHVDVLTDLEARLNVASPAHSGRQVLVDLAERAGKRMGFTRVHLLRQQGHLTEEQFAQPMFEFVMLNVNLARMAEDLRLWMSSEFNLFSLADEHASGSSGLPQKKNPFAFQTIIGGAAVGVGRLSSQLTSNIALSGEGDTVYHTVNLYQYACDVTKWTLLMAEMIELGEFNIAELKKKSQLGFAGGSEAMDTLIFEYGVPMRIAHHMLGAAVRSALEGADEASLQAQLRPQLTKYPQVDLAKILGILQGSILPETAMNIPAATATFTRLKSELDALAAKGSSNPIAEASERLIEEARRAVG